MEDEEPTLKNIAKEFCTVGYWGRARKRSAATKTGWDLLFMPIGFAAIGAYWYAFTKFFLWFHLFFYPSDSPRLRDLTDGPLTVALALIFLLPMFPAVPLGLLTSNGLMWLIPPARRASEQKAKGVKWATFHGAQLALFRMALVLVPIGAVGGIIGALILRR